MGRVFVFVGWRQILATTHMVLLTQTHTDTDTHKRIHRLNLIWYMPSWLVLLYWDFMFFSLLSPFSPAVSYLV